MLSEICRRQCCKSDEGRGFSCRGVAVLRSWRRHGSRTSVAKRGVAVERSLACILGTGGIDE